MASEPCYRFTAAEGGARLAAAARRRNTIVAEHTSFVATRLLHEDGFHIRGPLSSGYKRSIYVTLSSRVPVVTYDLNILTDLTAVGATTWEEVEEWKTLLEEKQVLVCTTAVAAHVLQEAILTMSQVNVLVIDSCHLIHQDQHMRHIMKCYKEADVNNRPRILALTYPLFSSKRKDKKDEVNDSDVNEKDENEADKNEKGKNDKDKQENDGDKIKSDGINESDTNNKIESCDDNINTDENDGEKSDTDKNKEDNSSIVNEKQNSEQNEEQNNKTESMKEEIPKIGEYENIDDFIMYEKLEWKIDQLEQELCCQIDLAEDIDGVKRAFTTPTKPKELIVEFSGQKDLEQMPEDYQELEAYMRATVHDLLEFFDDHRYDPTEIYGEDLYEEFKQIPDPSIEPKTILHQFLYVLEQLGPYCGDKAAFSLLTKLEKLRIKVPYERHFLLLCLCTSVFVKIRCYADLMFSKYESEWERIQRFSTPKVLRLAEILEKFTPPPSANEKDKDKNEKDKLCNEKDKEDAKTSDELLSEIEKCDFKSLGNKIEDQVNILVADLKEIDICVDKNDRTSNCNVSDKDKNQSDENDHEIENTANEKDKHENDKDKQENEKDKHENEKDKIDQSDKVDVSEAISTHSPLLGFHKRVGRPRGRRVPRSNNSRAQLLLQNPDALCGIVFMKESFMAKILFHLIVEMSRSRPCLSFIRAQYCAKGTEQDGEAGDRQRRTHEDVLKKFRMHECNLLLATSALEEGVELPRCNLVLRWDAPHHYRSHTLCRARARASRASCVLLSHASINTDTLLHQVATYTELDQIISRKCGCGIQNEPSQSEEDNADSFTPYILPYTPGCEDITSVNEKDKTANDKNKNVRGKDKNVSNEDENNSDERKNKANIDQNIKEQTKSEQNVNKKMSIENEHYIFKDKHKNSNVLLDEQNTRDLISNKCDQESNTESAKELCVSENEKDKNVHDKNGKDKNERNRNKNDETEDHVAKVDMSTAVALINRYCAKLPSDTFTRLAPQWSIEEVLLPLRGRPGEMREAYICTLRLPLNCPIKFNIVGHPMPSLALSRRAAALAAARALHLGGELDHTLTPIGKENFRAAELEIGGGTGGTGGTQEGEDARPGTTKRRQYYYKRTAKAFTDCEPIVDSTEEDLKLPFDPNNLKPDSRGLVNVVHLLDCVLCCALPERYNTRGRALHAPQHARHALAVLRSHQPQHSLEIPAFPVYTRSGEVRVSIRKIPDADVRVSPRRARIVRRFMRFVFAEVLRVRRRGMSLHAAATNENNYYVVPTIKTTREDGSTKIDIDWEFLELIYQHTEEKKLADVDKNIPWHLDEEELETSPYADKKTNNNVESGNEKDKSVNEKDKSVNEIDKSVNDKDKSVNSDKNSVNDLNDSEISTDVKNTLETNCDIPIDSKINRDQTNENKVLSQNETDKNVKDKNGGDKVKKMVNPNLKPGETFVFDPEKYKEAVVTPWYRNQDQPQFFLVAEICWSLTPDSAFPSATHTTFRSYYQDKYGVELTQANQPLLDVDHTSARLNLLTPRYVNRKGVALPVSSERTRRAKRDRLDQKQILVPELCRVHPFPAPLWAATVALPCVLYRINALLLADEIRVAVAMEAGVGVPNQAEPFNWPPLDFGWSLADVLNADAEKTKDTKPGAKSETEDKQNETEDKQKETELEPTQKETEEEIVEKKEKTINEILQEKEDESGFEIGTWSNEMAGSIPDDEEAYVEPLPPNITFCTSATGGANWCEPVPKPRNSSVPTRSYYRADSDCSYMSSDLSDDSDIQSAASDDDMDSTGFASGNNYPSLGVRIEYKSTHEAEAVDVERRTRTTQQPISDETQDNVDMKHWEGYLKSGDAPEHYKETFHASVAKHKEYIHNNNLIHHSEEITNILPEPTNINRPKTRQIEDKSEILTELFPYGTEESNEILQGEITVEKMEKHKKILLAELKKSLPEEEIKKLNCFSMVDVDIKSLEDGDYFTSYETEKNNENADFKPNSEDSKGENEGSFDFDYQPNLEGHPGPSPSLILQALTMSNANDGINLERLETVGDSFLKFAITAYLYCRHRRVHEGKLSHMRSKQVSNLNLYRLGVKKRLGTLMIASKFEPHDNWLPPCHSATHCDVAPQWDPQDPDRKKEAADGCFIPYNLITQHSIPDKSIADCVEALIGAYLIACGPRGALLLMTWLGIKVLPHMGTEKPSKPRPFKPKPTKPAAEDVSESETDDSDTEVTPHNTDEKPVFGGLRGPPSPLLRHVPDPEGELEIMLSGYEKLEDILQYRFRDRSLLLQALTHASHETNRLTDCYQRLEFLGDAILDYLITRHLFGDARRHSPGALTDLRSALVNNTIFATLAVRHQLYKFFRHMSPGLNEVLTKYVKIQEENGHSISEEYLVCGAGGLSCSEAEDVEVPKALGDLFESVAGAIFLDSGMSLGSVWRVYGRLMSAELEAFSAAAPKSPVRELLEAQPDTAKFGKPERLADGRRVRVCVEVFGRGSFRGVGRNYRIAKGTAAKCALRHLHMQHATHHYM